MMNTKMLCPFSYIFFDLFPGWNKRLAPQQLKPRLFYFGDIAYLEMTERDIIRRTQRGRLYEEDGYNISLNTVRLEFTKRFDDSIT